MKHGVDDPFRVMELFGTLQGEGTDLGRETIFMRLYGCNLSCVWCDTAHSWDDALYFEGIYTEYETGDLVLDIEEMTKFNGITHMVITGGEPLLHNHKALVNLIGNLDDIKHVTFETNGTILPHKELVKVTGLFSVSPKLKSSQNVPFNPTLLTKWIDRVGIDHLQFKFVVANQMDADEVVEMIKTTVPDPAWEKVSIIFQPEESANNYKELPMLISSAFSRAGLNKTDFNIRYIPQVHKFYGIR